MVRLTTENIGLYSKVIRYETGVRPSVKDGKVYIDGKIADSYTFKWTIIS